MLIDRLSYRSFLKEVNPVLKTLSAGIVLIMLLSTGRDEVFVFNFAVSNFIMLYFIRVRVHELLKLYSVPLFFIMTTAVSLIWTGNDVKLFILRAFSSISVVYALVCSTPITDLDYVFCRLKFPKIFRELFLIVYRYIFVLLDIKDKLLNAQKTRQGYENYKNSIKSFTILAASVLRKTGYYSMNTAKAVESRSGTEFLFVHRKYRKIGMEAAFIASMLLINLFLAVGNYV